MEMNTLHLVAMWIDRQRDEGTPWRDICEDLGFEYKAGFAYRIWNSWRKATGQA